MKRRKEDHDYHEKRFYMITLAVEGRHPILGHLESRNEHTDMVLSPLGDAIKREWMRISSIYPQVAVIALQVMPDHLHGILYVREHTDFHIGQVIKGFKLGCNRELRRSIMVAMESQPTREGEKLHTREGESLHTREGESQPTREGEPLHTREGEKQHTREGEVEQQKESGELQEEENKEGTGWSITKAMPLPLYAAISSQPNDKATLWEQGYNDRILHNYSTLDKWKKYLQDNPNRLAIRKMHPDFFRVRFGLTLDGQTFSAIGNRFLLDYPDKEQVQLSRSLTEEEIKERITFYLTKARSGTVLVSPAISKGEQAVMRTILDAGLPLIFLTPWGFNTFSKPSHQYYNACANGRFLILAPWPHQNERIPLTRTMCMELNDMTRKICEA